MLRGHVGFKPCPMSQSSSLGLAKVPGDAERGDGVSVRASLSERIAARVAPLRVLCALMEILQIIPM